MHDLLRAKGVDVWVFSGLDWLLVDADNAHVAPEIRVVRFQPTLVRSLEPALASAFKIVGVSEDHDLLARCEAELQAALGEQASVSRSQPFYLDVTHPLANKGMAVTRLAALMGVPLAEVAVIGDGHNDVGMFAQGGLSIAMGNAVPDVLPARFVTGSNDTGLCQPSHGHPRRMTPDLEILADPEALARHAADRARRRAGGKDHFAIALSGAPPRSGSISCWPTHRCRGRARTGSGATALCAGRPGQQLPRARGLADHVPVPKNQIYPIPTTGSRRTKLRRNTNAR